MTSGRWPVPDAWEWVRSETIADIVGGGTPRADDESNFSTDGIPWITPADLTGYKSVYIGRGRRDLSDKGIKGSGATLLPSGTVLFSSRAPVGYCAIAANAISTNQGFKSLVLKGGISPEFVRYYLLSAKEYAESLASGTTFLELSAKRMSELEIPLPPLPEQRRIVRKLDALSARSTTARTHLTAIEKLVERYRKAVLEAAFRAAWDAGCDTTIAGCLDQAETGLVRSKAEQTPDEGYPYIRMNHYDLAGRWNDRDLTYVAATPSEFDRYELKANDLLFNTRNSAELVGKVAIWPAGKEGYLFNNNLLRMRFSPDVVPAFAFWQMSSPPFRRYIEGFISATTSVAAIYQRSLMAAPFWVPDTDEQREIVRRIETAFAKIDRLKAEAAKALKLLGHLDQRILAKAFAGDLVPQDPTDEPAETLLARIRETKAAAPKSRRGRK